PPHRPRPRRGARIVAAHRPASRRRAPGYATPRALIPFLTSPASLPLLAAPLLMYDSVRGAWSRGAPRLYRGASESSGGWRGPLEAPQSIKESMMKRLSLAVAKTMLLALPLAGYAAR